MKIQTIIGLTGAFLLALSCTREEMSMQNTDGVLTATAEGNDLSTKVGFDKDGKFYWSTGDQIGVTTEENTTCFSSLTLSGGSGSATATFNGQVSGEISGYAVYPFNEHHSMSENTLTYCFPSEYTYEKVDSDFFTEQQGEGNSFNPAMWGSIEEGSTAMKHLGGVFCIKFESMPASAGTLTFTTDKAITGEFTADLSTGTPVLTSDTESSEGNTVTISFSGATEGQSGVFYIPVPTGTYNNVRIKVSDNTGTEKANIAAGNLAITRKLLKVLTISPGSIVGTPETEANDLDEAASILESNDAVSVTGQVSSEANIDIPAAEGNKTLILENIASDASLTVNDGNSEGPENESVDNLTISIPNNDADDFQPLDMDINMPNSTVTLAGNIGTAVFGTVTASTAENTLVISSGVTVQKVIVKKGNIRVNSGAVISEITKDESNSGTVTIYKEQGATIPESLDENTFKVVDASVADLNKVFTEGGEYILTEDMDITATKLTVPEGIDATLDLNGRTMLAANNANIVVYGTLTLKNSQGDGRIEATKDYGAPYTTGLIYITGEDAKMVMQGGTIYAVREDAANKGQFGVTVWDGGDFTIEGGRIEAGWYAIAGNGNNKTQNSIIEIKGGELISTADYAVYLPHSGETNVTGGLINGAAGGISIQRGSLNISGDNTQILSQDTGDTGEWNDGTGDLPNSAICVAGEYGACTVNIEGGTFLSKGDAITIDKQESTYTQDINVSGGTFSDPSVLTYYLAQGANINIELDSDYTGPGFGLYETEHDGYGKNSTITVDLNGHTWNVEDTPLFGSAGTESQYFHLEKGTAVTFKDGIIKAADENSGKMLIQNYCALTLDGINIMGGPNCSYIISNNNESCLIRNTTVTASEGNVAFDVYAFSTYEGVTVTVEGESVINGKVEFGGNNNNKNIYLIVNGGTFNGPLSVDENYYDSSVPNIQVSPTATFADEVMDSWSKYFVE